jgi:hypothetical protein
MRASLALAAVRRGHLEEAERLVDEIGEVGPSDMTASLAIAQVRAEVLLRRGDLEAGLAGFHACVAMARGWSFSGTIADGLEPWTLIALATDLAAHAQFAETPDQEARGRALAVETGELLARFPGVADVAVDYPVTGMTLAGLGLWLLDREPDEDPDIGVRLLALAHGFGYNRWFPALGWEHLTSVADTRAPGRLAAVLEEYGDSTGRELRPEAERVLARSAFTSSG